MITFTTQYPISDMKWQLKLLNAKACEIIKVDTAEVLGTTVKSYTIRIWL